MKTRILSGLILAPFLILLYFGGYVLMAGCLFVAFVGLHEFFQGFRAMGFKPAEGVGIFAVLLLYGLNIWVTHKESAPGTGAYLFWFFLVIVLAFGSLLLTEYKGVEGRVEDPLATVTGIFYVVFFSFHVMLVDQTDYRILVWIIVLSAFGTDIFAYFTGYFLGKHKLCPTISPKKTVEGSVGGILGAVAACGIFGFFFARPLLVHCLILGALGGVFSQMGDLSASIFKRKMGIKDYGNLIPGHGGILDRFDSVLFTAPMVYYYILFVL